MARPRAEGDERICRRRNKEGREGGRRGAAARRRRGEGGAARPSWGLGRAQPGLPPALSPFGAPPAAASQGGPEERRDATWREGLLKRGRGRSTLQAALAPAPGAKAAADALEGEVKETPFRPPQPGPRPPKDPAAAPAGCPR